MDILVDCSKGGICRNLKNIVNGSRLAEYHKLHMVIYWPTILHVMQKQHGSAVKMINIDNIRFTDIIENIKIPYDLVTQKAELSIYNFKIVSCTHEVNPLPHELDLLPDKFSELQYLITKNYKSLTYEFENIPLAIRNNIVTYFKYIEINATILNVVTKFIQKNRNTNQKLIGVSIRTWPEHKDREKWYSLKNYTTKLDDLISSGIKCKIFVCSDNVEPIEKLKELYGDQIVEYDDIVRVRGGSWNINFNDIIDLCIMAKCDVIMGSLTSNWLEVAWYLSECNAKYITINEIYNDECYQLILR